MQEDYAPNSGHEIFAVAQLMLGQMMNESVEPGSLIDAAAETRLNQWFRSANKSERSTNARLQLPAQGSRQGLPSCSNPYRTSRACLAF